LKRPKSHSAKRKAIFLVHTETYTRPTRTATAFYLNVRTLKVLDTIYS